MCTRGERYLYGSLVLLALPGSPQRHPQQWMCLCIGTGGEKLCFSTVINGTYLTWVASAWRMRHLRVGRECLCLGRLPKTHPQLTYSSCQKKKGARTWTHAHVRTCKSTAKGSGTVRKGNGRTPCNGRWASSGSPTSARRKTSHLWQLPCPTCC